MDSASLEDVWNDATQICCQPTSCNILFPLFEAVKTRTFGATAGGLLASCLRKRIMSPIIRPLFIFVQLQYAKTLDSMWFRNESFFNYRHYEITNIYIQIIWVIKIMGVHKNDMLSLSLSISIGLYFPLTVHSPTPPSLYLHHSSFSNPFIASPTSQLILWRDVGEAKKGRRMCYDIGEGKKGLENELWRR